MKLPIFGGELSPQKGQGGWSTKVCKRAHGCGLWRSIHEGWESFSQHLSFVVGEGTRIRF